MFVFGLPAVGFSSILFHAGGYPRSQQPSPCLSASVFASISIPHFVHRAVVSIKKEGIFTALKGLSKMSTELGRAFFIFSFYDSIYLPEGQRVRFERAAKAA